MSKDIPLPGGAPAPASDAPAPTPSPSDAVASLQADASWSADFSGANGRQAQKAAMDRKTALLKPAEDGGAVVPEHLREAMENSTTRPFAEDIPYFLTLDAQIPLDPANLLLTSSSRFLTDSWSGGHLELVATPLRSIFPAGLTSSSAGLPMDYRDNPQHRVLHHTKWCTFTPANGVFLLRR